MKQLLKKFSAFIVTAMMFSVSVNAQIVYTDVNPDSVISAGSAWDTIYYNIDLNSDGISDVTFSQTHRYTAHLCSFDVDLVSIMPATNNNVTGSGTTFDSSASWGAGGALAYTQEGMLCNPVQHAWVNSNGGYEGVKLKIGNQYHYGWIKISVPGFGSSLTVKEFAYNTIPNQPILAGQTITTGLTENSFASSINLFPNPASNHLTIALGSNNKKVEVTITDITGKIIYTITTNKTNKIEVNTNEFAEGIYIVQIQVADFIGTKKLVVEK